MATENQIEIFEPGSLTPARRRPAALATLDVEPAETLNLHAYWLVLRKRRWTVAAVFALIFAVVLLVTLRATPLYQSKASIEIEKENPNIVTAQDLFEMDNVSNSFLETQYKVLESESLARRVIRNLKLAELPEFNPPPRWWSMAVAARQPDSGTANPQAATAPDSEATRNALKAFRDRLNIEPIKQSRVVEVSFESRNPQLSAQVINDLAAAYIDRNLELRWQEAQAASEWISQQLVGVRSRLEKSEDAMQKYTREKGLLYLENEKGTSVNIVDARLRQLQEELTKAEAARMEKEGLFRLVDTGEYASLPTVFENRELQDLTLRLSELRDQDALLEATFSEDYPKRKQLRSQVAAAQQTLDQERERAATRIRNDYVAAAHRESLLRATFAATQHESNDIAEKSVQYNILKRDVDTNRGLYDGLLERLKQAGVSAGLKESNIRIIDAAVPARYPTKPRVALNLSLGLILGACVGVGAAFLQEHADNSLKTAEDIERVMHLPALAAIPAVESLERGREGRMTAVPQLELESAGSAGDQAAAQTAHWYRIDDLKFHQSGLAEAFRGLRTSVLLSAADRPPRSLLISSAQPAEGKTTVAINLAISLAQLGQRVLLIEGDLRRPSIHRAFRVNGSPGLVSYLTGRRDWRSIVEKTSEPELDVLVCGPLPPNPAELLSSDRMDLLIQEALREYKIVVIDSPPLLSVADSRILATLVEGVVLVVKGGVTPRQLSLRAKNYARDVGAHVIGVVLNNIDLHREEYAYYQNYIYPSHEAAAPDGG